jgi:hypothetical protein
LIASVPPKPLLSAVSSRVPAPVLVRLPLLSGTSTRRSVAAVPLATLTARVLPPRSSSPELPAPALVLITAIAPDRPVMFTSPLSTSLPGVAPRMSVSVLNVRFAAPPAVKFRAASTWTVCAVRLAPPEMLTGPENCAEIGPACSTLGLSSGRYVGS